MEWEGRRSEHTTDVIGVHYIKSAYTLTWTTHTIYIVASSHTAYKKSLKNLHTAAALLCCCYKATEHDDEEVSTSS